MKKVFFAVKIEHVECVKIFTSAGIRLPCMILLHQPFYNRTGEQAQEDRTVD
jgi:hypothetical protein